MHDCAALAAFLIRTEMPARRFTAGIRACGGALNVVTITEEDGYRVVMRRQPEVANSEWQWREAEALPTAAVNVPTLDPGAGPATYTAAGVLL